MYFDLNWYPLVDNPATHNIIMDVADDSDVPAKESVSLLPRARHSSAQDSARYGSDGELDETVSPTLVNS